MSIMDGHIARVTFGNNFVQHKCAKGLAQITFICMRYALSLSVYLAEINDMNWKFLMNNLENAQLEHIANAGSYY